jgi:NAD(P)-dependent dehydrogenase (short-subunit alcohol dehydrogenase family)
MNRSAFISGGSSGIGLTLAGALLDLGYGVTISARRPEKLEQAAAGLAERGDVHAVAADVRDEQQIETAVESHAGRFGRLDVLVNNAGAGFAGPLAVTDAKRIDLMLAVNLRSAILCTRAAAPMLIDAAPSHVFNISSYAAVSGQAQMTAYSAAKAGLNGFTEAAQAELGPQGVGVTSICPAFVDTAMAVGVSSVVEREELITTEDVATVIVSLLSLSRACHVPSVVMKPLVGGLQGWSGVTGVPSV